MALAPVLRRFVFLLLICVPLLATSEERKGEILFNDHCFSCHGTGWENAPVIGDNFAWEERKQKGVDALLQNTLTGINAMPPKGTCDDCSEQELRATIEYLIAE